MDVTKSGTSSIAEPPRARTAQTEMTYQRRAGELIERTRKDLRKDGQPSPKEIISWLIGRKEKLAPATWRQYRAVLVWINSCAQADSRLSNEAKAIWSEQTDRLKHGGTKGCAQNTKRTSACKVKGFPAAELQKLRSALTRNEGRYNSVLSDMLEAGALTGLRPSEWKGTRVVGMWPLILHVPNAKIGNDRANGSVRTLTFREISNDDRAAITNWLAYIASSSVPYATLQKKLADVMYRVVRQVWPKRKRHYTMYSGRHEFAALAKLHYGSQDASTASLMIAALMGHASDVTATQHYARYRSKGLPPDLKRALDRLPSPAPREVATVRARLAKQRSFLTQRSAPERSI